MCKHSTHDNEDYSQISQNSYAIEMLFLYDVTPLQSQTI